MSKIKVGLPSKGRIQEEMNNFLTSAGIDIKKDGGQRTYVGSFSNFEGFEIRFLSANEIAKERNLAHGSDSQRNIALNCQLGNISNLKNRSVRPINTVPNVLNLFMATRRLNGRPHHKASEIYGQ